MPRPLAPAVPTPRAPWGWAAVAAVLGLLAGVLLFAPARWAAAAVSQATGGRVLLDGARGTVWNGSARLVVTGGTGSRDAASLASPVTWRLRPAAQGMRLEVESACCTPRPLALRLSPRVGAGVLGVEDSGASVWPAGLLSGLGTPWNTLQPEGELQLRTQGLVLRWSQGRLEIGGRAELTAQRLSSRLATVRPLGSYRMVLEGGATPGLVLSTIEGPLQLTGRGQWVGGRLRFNGEAVATPERETALSNLLNIIGQRSGARSLITIG
jgi:general secretion pathway protein N